MLIIGVAGWSGSGKTTLITKAIPVLVRRGITVATVKHAHHEFDIDRPGKDSWLHREAGASEVAMFPAGAGPSFMAGIGMTCLSMSLKRETPFD
jgi:molybdopterin-guanine dinucleotide biosynthesis protein MobB